MARDIKFMRYSFFPAIAAALVLNAANGAEPHPLPFVSPVFGNDMVLQRGKPDRIWGWSKPGEKIQVSIGGQSAETTAAPDGRWQVQIEPPQSPGPYTLRVRGDQTASFTNVLVGDVWLCGGQSNMELPLSRTRDAARQIQAADCPTIRLFKVKSQCSYAPSPVPQGTWKVCSPKTVTEDGGFSAVGYFFARKIQSETNVPIGLIQDCLGGTPAESWTSAATLAGFSDFGAALKEMKRLRAEGGPVYGNYVMPWYDKFDIGQKENWFAPDFDDRDWTTVTIPGGFRQLGVADTPSVCYFRKAITLPNPLPAGPAKILLGVIERMDTTEINGRWIGASAWVENPRAYPIPAGVLKPGTNVIAVRVFKTKPNGGFLSRPEQLKLVFGGPSGTARLEIALAGEWKGKVSVDARPPHPLPLGFENWPVMPAVLYNGMIAPVAPLAISGVLWYQGESNVGRAAQYRRLLPAMIRDWRNIFAQGDFPFYIVSLPRFLPHRDVPGDDGWAELREAQALTARTVPRCALAVTIDTGEADNIHAKDKKPVGDRLALCALATYYGQHVVFSGPTLASVKKLPGALKLQFENTDGGLVSKGGQPGEFSVAGADRKWFWADAKIEGDAVVVSSPKVPQPQAARYAWQANPTATLFNGAGLPAAPFRTDDWPDSTERHQ